MDLLHDIFRIWFGQLEPTLTRYVIFAVAVWLALWVVLAPLLRARKIREATPPAKQLVTEFVISIRSMVIFATTGLVTVFMERAGLYPLPEMASGWGPVWFWASLAITFVAHDAYFYWVHRLMHRPKTFRTFHLRHHRSNNPSPFTAYSFDLGEAGLMVAFFIVWPMIFPMAWGVNGLFMLVQIARNTFLHSGYELRPARRDGRPWFDFMTTATHHDLHHGQAGYNYAAWFTWWDRWMGTEHPEYLQRYAERAWTPKLPKVVAEALTLPARAD